MDIDHTRPTARPTAPPPSGSVVVGIDGSPGADRALDWAAAQAALEHRPLTILHAAHLTMSGGAGVVGMAGVDPGLILDELRVVGQELLANAERRARRLEPTIDVHTVFSTDDARGALLHLAEHAAVVVVGSRGRGTLATLLLGSVSVSVSKHAACPVVVVRHDRGAATGGGILVGVDGTEASPSAVEFAYRTASTRSLPLTAMLVFWSEPNGPSPDFTAGDREVADDEPGLDALRAVLSEAVAGMGEKFPDVQARVSLVRGYRDRELIEASQGRDLLVIGSRQRGAVNDFLHGAVSPTVVEHARCDVAVVPVGIDLV